MSDAKVAAVAASLAAVALGTAAGYFLGQSGERRKHALDEVDDLIGDSAPLATARSVPAEEDEFDAATPSSAAAGAAASSEETAAPGGGVPRVPSLRLGATPPRASKRLDAVGRAASGVVVHIDEARRKHSLDQSYLGGPVIVGVAGGSGSGKTSIASLIAARLDGRAVLSISSDNYYITLSPGTDPSEYNFDHPSAIDYPLLATHLAALKRGERVEVPTYDFVHHKRTSKTIPVCGRSTDVIIVDGLFILHWESVRGLCDVTLFTAEDSDVCLARRLRRDLVERGRTVESVLAQYLKFVKAGYSNFIAPSMSAADFIIPRARDNAVAIDMLARDIERRVAENAAARSVLHPPAPHAAHPGH